MPDLSDLGLTADATPQVDWDAPESGTTPPPVTPGTFTFMFKLPKDRKNWFDAMEVQLKDASGAKRVDAHQQPVKGKFLVLNFAPQIVGDKDGNPYPAPTDGTELPTLPFQRASFYKTDKMLISFGAELLRALGIRITGAMTPEAIEAAVEGVDGRALFKGEVIWRAYFKGTETTVSTSPRKRTPKGPEFPWPKDSDGTFQLTVTNPKNPNDQKQYGRAEITRVHLINGNG